MSLANTLGDPWKKAEGTGFLVGSADLARLKKGKCLR